MIPIGQNLSMLLLHQIVAVIDNINMIISNHNHSIKLHLLGCAVPQEFGWYNNHPQIESIDTSNPIMATLDGITYTEQGLVEKPKANMNEYFGINPYSVNYEDILKNVKRFRKINGLKSYGRNN